MSGQLHRATILALVIIALGFGLRLYRLDAQSFWHDEAYSAGVAAAAPADIVANQFSSVHPPLYYLLLHCWLALGQGDFVLRLFSAMLGVAGIAAIYSLGRVLYDESVGLVAATITAMSPFSIYYSQEARMYSLLFLLGCLLISSYARMLQTDSPGWWAAYAALGALGLNTHFFCGLLILSLHLHFVLRRTPWGKPWRTLTFCDGLILLTMVPRLGVVASQIGKVAGDYWIRRPSFAQLLSAPHNFTLSQHISHTLIPFAFGLVLFLFIVTHLQVTRELARGGPDTAALALTLVVFWTPLLVTFVLSQWRPIYLERSLMVAVPGLYLLLAWGAVSTRERFVNSALAVLLALFAVNGLWNWYFDPDFAKPSFRAAAQFLQEQAEPSQPILHTSDGAFVIFAHYAPEREGYLLQGDPTPALPVQTYELFGGGVVAKEVWSAPRFWLVVALDNSIDFQTGSADWFEAHYMLLDSHIIDGIYLLHYDGAQGGQG